MKVISYSFFEPGEGKSGIDQHFAWLTTAWKSYLSNQDKNLISVKELIKATKTVSKTHMYLYKINNENEKKSTAFPQL